MKNSFLVFLICLSAAATAQYKRGNILIKSYDTTSTAGAISLVRGNTTKTVLVNHDLSVHFRNSGLRSDSARYHARGAFMSIQKDSMFIRTPQIYVHDKYKRNDDSLYSYFHNTRHGVASIPVHEINTIYYERVQLKKVTAGLTILSLVSAFVVAPLAALEHGRENLTKFRKVAYPSLGVTVASVAVGIIFAQKKYVIRSKRKNARVWTIRPGM